MIFTSQDGSWSLEIPPGWELSTPEWEPGFTARYAEARLRVMQLWSGPVATAADRRRQVVERNRALGHTVVDVEYGTFVGHLIEVEDGDLWCRCWLLSASGTELEVAYSCPRANADRDDIAIDQMLRTLTILVVRQAQRGDDSVRGGVR